MGGIHAAAARAMTSVWIPLRVKIALPYFILASVLALGSAYVVTQLVFDSVNERFLNQLAESGKLASEWMVAEENNLIDTLRLIRYTEGVGDSLEAGDVESLGELAYGVVVGQQEEAVEFLNLQGEIVVSLRHVAGNGPEEYQLSQKGDDSFAQVPFVRRVLDQEIDAYGDKFSGLVQAGWGDYFYVAGPVTDSEGNFVGVILVGKSLQALAREMHAGILAHITFYDLNGQVLSSTFVDSHALNLSDVSIILADQDQLSYTRSQQESQETGLAGSLSASERQYAEILGPWEVRDDQDIGLIGVSIVKTFLVTASRTTRIQISGLVGMALLTVIALGFQVANIITRPLIGLVRASEQVAAGNLDVQVRTSTNDEISVLTQTFNSMITSLYSSKMALLQAYDTTLEGWAKALELRDEVTKGHSLRVTELTVKLAERLGIHGEALGHVRRGALLHDIGKMGIPDAVLLKQGSLNDEEWQIMRRHPQYAYDMLCSIEYLLPALEIPYCHHENWDGSGYPRGLKAIEIPISARIFSVVDVWDALLSDRPYRKRMPVESALDHIRRESGTKFDPQVVDAFLSLIDNSGNGSQRDAPIAQQARESQSEG